MGRACYLLSIPRVARLSPGKPFTRKAFASGAKLIHRRLPAVQSNNSCVKRSAVTHERLRARRLRSDPRLGNSCSEPFNPWTEFALGSGDLKDGPEARRGAATPEASSLTSPDPKARINHGFQGGEYPRWGWGGRP